MKYKVSVIGLGYVGLVISACLASRGFKVIGLDVDVDKVNTLNKGSAPIYEPNLDTLIRESVEKGFLKATSDYENAIKNTDVTFITVGTPSKADGSIDLTYIKESSKMIGKVLSEKEKWHLIIVKSTVTPLTTENIIKKIIEEYSGKKCPNEFGLCMNPEFLREGNAVEDFLNPYRIVIGECDKRSGDVLEELYREFYGVNMPPIIRTNTVNAEIIKYVSNSFLAMKVSFINMVANLCNKIPDADVEVIAKALGFDKRINPYFLRAGAGWGGSCWPKDLNALKKFADQIGVSLPLINSTFEVNDRQPYKMVELAENLIGKLYRRRIAVLGLSFKPGTDDMRNAVSIKIVNKLVDEDADVVVYDPVAIKFAKKIFGDNVEYALSIDECLKNAECALIVTEWDEFKKLKPEDFIRYMKVPAIVDGRRIYDPILFSSKLRFAAIGLGRRRYNNPAMAVNAIITKDDEILLVKRNIEPYKDMWSLPGGFIEYDETVEEALVREVLEETGLKVKPKRIFNIFSKPLRNPLKHTISICYEVDVVGGVLKAGVECSGIKYFSVNKLPNEMAFDHMHIIDEYMHRINRR